MVEKIYGNCAGSFDNNGSAITGAVLQALFLDSIESILNGLSSSPAGLSGVSMEEFEAHISLSCYREYANEADLVDKAMQIPTASIVLLSLKDADAPAFSGIHNKTDLEEILDAEFAGAFAVEVLAEVPLLCQHVNRTTDLFSLYSARANFKIRPTKAQRNSGGLFHSDEHLTEHEFRSYLAIAWRLTSSSASCQVGFGGNYQLSYTRIPMKASGLRPILK